ncbi:MAG: EVE domain-containing protein [Chloroflexi bacterium]|nr:EVE domain-containing protein [Chloroflexota bacterium]
MGNTYWLIATTYENFQVTRDRGFSVQGVDTRNRRKAVRMAAGDRIVYYISDRHAFAATVTLTSGHFEDHEPIWKHHSQSEDFPHRVRTRADVVTDEGSWVDGMQIGPRLEYVSKWPPEMWPLALVGSLHIIPQKDFSMLEEELKKAASGETERRRGRGRRDRRGRRGREAPRRVAPASAD